MNRMRLAGALLCAASAAAQARVTELVVEKTAPFADGQAFGDAGAYEIVVGKLRGELDPGSSANRGIVNLHKAPRNAAGKVEYETDFAMLRPADAKRANGKLLYEVNNRGRKFLLHWVYDAPALAASATNDLFAVKDPGKPFLLRDGWTIAWTGWDPDAPRTGAGMAMSSIVPTQDGAPIVRTIREELVSGTRSPAADTFRLSYDSTTLESAKAKLTVRRNEADPRREIAAGDWKFVDARTVALLPEGRKPEAGSLYELVYPARDPKVLGVGFAATRDAVAWLRDKEHIRTVLALGISQSGRYLRDHLAQGFNADESGQRVFDGVLAHISGVGRVFLNTEFGEPARTNTQHEDHLYPENAFPFSSAEQTDTVTGRHGSLLRGGKTDPLLIEVNTATEYWQKGASLLHTDTRGKRDAALPATTRVYMIAGTQHAGRVGLPTAKGPCVAERNPNSSGPVLRALVAALDAWVTTGEEPPASRVPTLANASLVPAYELGFPAIPGVRVPKAGNVIALFGDWVTPKPDPDKAYTTLVSRVDADGNEASGIRLPPIAVPLATYTGWNFYAAPFPEGELCDRDGSYWPFAKTRAEREARGDPRPSVEERYLGSADYAGKVIEVASQLARERLLLQEDAEEFAIAAMKRRPLD